MKLRRISFIIFSRYIDTPSFWRTALFLSAVMGQLRNKAPKWKVLHGYALEMLGKTGKAVNMYQRAVEAAQKSASMSAVRWQHPSQFFLERSYYRVGRPRETDPIFSCSLKPAESSDLKEKHNSGSYKAEFTFSGLMIMGMVPGDADKTVGVYINGQLLREFSIGDGFPFPSFNITILRSTLSNFPESSNLSVKIRDGAPLTLFGRIKKAASYDISVPHGTGVILEASENSVKLEKKGNIIALNEEIEKRKRKYLKLYETVREFFEKKYDWPLIVLYGTLLGCYRNGDLIDGDDDFDMGWVSKATDPVSLKKEMFDIMLDLIEAGFIISFNRTGRLFRLHAPLSKDNNYEHLLHLDVTPVWFQEGKAWSHNHFCMPSDVADFLPAQSRIIKGTKVYIPAVSEKFLLHQYGPGWKVPDPSFIYHRSEMDKKMLANLAKAFITPGEYHELLNVIEEKRLTNPSIGKLVSIGSQSFYPLCGLEEDLE